MTRPLTIAACLAAALLASPAVYQLASAQTAEAGQDATTTQAPAAEQPAAETAAPAVPAAPAAGPAALVGNPDNGRALTYTCQGCHGIVGYRNVYPTFHVPLIGGQSQLYLSNALHAYKQGTRSHPTMQAQAQSFSDQDIADIAAFLSGLTP